LVSFAFLFEESITLSVVFNSVMCKCCFLINFQLYSFKSAMLTNHAVAFGHTHIKLEETENVNMCCLCTSHAVLLSYLLHIIGHFMAPFLCVSGQPLNKLWIMQLVS
jgi:hypothetical protein